MVEGPPGGGVPDDQDPPAVVAAGEVVEERADAVHDVLVALPSREGDLDPLRALALESLDRRAVQRTVVALPQPGIRVDRDRGAREGDLRRLHGASEVRGEHRLDPVGATALIERPGQAPTPGGQTSVPPPCGDAALVVLAQRMSLEDDLDGHAPMLTIRGGPGRRRGRAVVRHDPCVAWLDYDLGSARALFTDRTGGVSPAPFDTANLAVDAGDDARAVEENRRRAGRRLGPPAMDSATWVPITQVHGATVVWAAAVDHRVEADAVVLDAPGLTALILTADCAPVALAGGTAAAAVHVGWRGLLEGIVPGAVASLAEIDGMPTRAVVGPCIGPCCYEFGFDDLDRVAATLGDEVRARTRDGRPALDLPAAVHRSLNDAGVAHVESAAICTACSTDYFSYRRDGASGRQGLLLALSAAGPRRGAGRLRR